MWNEPSKARLAKIPRIYETEHTQLKDRVVHLHFFIGGCDWYAAEYDTKDQLFFGFAILNNDLEMAEWGLFSLKELNDLKVSFLEINRDLHWTPTKAENIEKIREAQGWQMEAA